MEDSKATAPNSTRHDQQVVAAGSLPAATAIVQTEPASAPAQYPETAQAAGNPLAASPAAEDLRADASNEDKSGVAAEKEQRDAGKAAEQQPAAATANAAAPSDAPGGEAAPAPAATMLSPQVAPPQVASTEEGPKAAVEPASTHPEQPTQQQRREEATAVFAPSPGPPPPPPLQAPGVRDERHPLKPQWRRGLEVATNRIVSLGVTVTPSDCNTGRLRPPRPWYDALLGGAFATFAARVGADTLAALGAGADVRPFSLKAVAYEYAKSEYYIQGTEAKRLFRGLRVQPGDMVVLRAVPSAVPSGAEPLTEVAIVRSGDNPYADIIVGSAAMAAAKRAERAPKRPAAAGGGGAATPGSNRKRKVAPTKADAGDATGHYFQDHPADEDPDYEEGGKRKDGRGRRAARSRKFPYDPDDFDTGHQRSQKKTSFAAMAGGGKSALGAVPTAGAAAGNSSAEHGGFWNDGFPAVIASGMGGRNVLTIRMPSKASRAAQHTTSGGGGSERAPRGASNGGDVLDMLARAADGIRTPKVAQAVPPAAPAAGGAAAPVGRLPMALLSKSLTRDAAGAVTGARLTLRWEPGSRAAAEVSRRLSEYGLRHHEAAEIDEYEVKVEECSVRLALRLLTPGKVAVLEKAVADLMDMV